MTTYLMDIIISRKKINEENYKKINEENYKNLLREILKYEILFKPHRFYPRK
jgi:hypothetical protein